MKWSLFACALGGLVLVPAVASAETVKANLIGYMVFKTPEACGTSIEVTQSNGGLTDGTEKLSLGLKYNYSFGTGGFSPPSGGFNVGAKVLFASPSFASQTGAKADISIPDADCKDFNLTGGALRFSGSLGRNPDIINYQIPANFGAWKAFTPTGTVDLSKDSFPFGGFTSTWTLSPGGGMTSGGTSGMTTSGMPTSSSGTSGTSGESSGCTVSRSGHGSTEVGIAGVALGLALALRRRRSRSST